MGGGDALVPVTRLRPPVPPECPGSLLGRAGSTASSPALGLGLPMGRGGAEAGRPIWALDGGGVRLVWPAGPSPRTAAP